MTPTERLSRIQGEAQSVFLRGHRTHEPVVDPADVRWLCAELRTAWQQLERARATAAGLALEPSAYDIGTGDGW